MARLAKSIGLLIFAGAFLAFHYWSAKGSIFRQAKGEALSWLIVAMAVVYVGYALFRLVFPAPSVVRGSRVVFKTADGGGIGGEVLEARGQQLLVRTQEGDFWIHRSSVM